MTGAAPTGLAIGGDGIAGGATASLSISNSELYLVITGGTLYPPTMGGITLSSGSAILTFSGTNGQTYQVLTSTDVATPLTNWISVASGTFSGTPVSYTNSPASEAKRFFIITSP